MKQIKRILSCLLVCAMMLTSFSAVFSFAADKGILSLSSAEAEKGGTATLEINLENNPGVMAMQIYVKYDKTALTLPSTSKGQKNGDLFESLSRGVSPTFYNTEEDAVDDGLVGTLIFTVNAEAAPGDYTVELQILSAGNYDETLSKDDFTVVNGTITVLGDPEPTTATVTTSATAGGTVTPGGEFEIGADVTVTATPDFGYKFVGWYNGEAKVSDDVNYTFAAAETCTLTAKFEKITYSIAVDGAESVLNPYFANGNIWTEADGAIKPAQGTMENFILFDNALAVNRVEATFKDLPHNYDGDTRNGIVFALTDIDGDHAFGMDAADVSYYWACVSGYGEVQLIGFPGWKNYTTGGSVDLTTDVTLAVEWDAEGNVKVFANGELRIEKNVGESLTGNLYGVLMRSWSNTEGGGFAHAHTVTSFVAGGALATPDNEVTVTVDPTDAGTVTGAGDYYLGQQVTLTATANPGYTFAGWYEGETLVSSEATITFAAADRNLTAKFTNITHTVTVTPGENGTATGGDVYAEGASATVTATPNVGYKFAGWYVDDAKVSADAAYTFEVTADITLVAKFEKVEYTIPVDVDGNKLNPYFVNGQTWVEEDGSLNMPTGLVSSFILFDNALTANRVEATFHMTQSWSNDNRTGIVFALTDIDGDHTWENTGADVSYYWAYISGTGKIGVMKMGKYSSWTRLKEVNASDFGVNFSEFTLAVEWDDQGNVKVYANDTLVIDVADATGTPVLTGNLYGLLIRAWGNSTGNYSDTVTSFVVGKEQVTITATGENGTVTGAGDYYLGDNVTLTASANTGYKFVGWYDGETEVSKDATISFTAEADRELTAKFAKETYTITATGENGTVEGAGNYEYGADVTLTATANTGYKFLGWYEGETEVSKDATITFTAEANRELTAKFAKETYTITATGENGTVEGAGNYEYGADVTLTATANDGYKFLGWYEGETEVSKDATITFTAEANRELTAKFAKNTYTITVTTENGTVEGAGNYEHGADVTLTATANDGYTFVGWYENGALVSEDATISFTAEANRELTATFAKDKYVITVTAGEGGTATEGGEYEEGTPVTLIATVNEGYKFLGWYIGEDCVSEATTYIHTVEASCEIVAKFVALDYYDVVVNATEGGNVTGGNSVVAGSSVTVIATPEADYNFLGWYENGALVSAETSYTFTVSADRTLEARFEKKPAPVTGLDTEVESETGETATGVIVSTDKAGYEMGEEFTATVEITNSEYMFIGWYQDGILRSADLTYTDIYFEGIVLTAKVVKKPENNGFAYIFGYTDTEIGAEGTLLRGEAAQIIYRLFAQAGNATLGEGFDDMDGWFQNGLLYVSNTGLWSISTSAYPYAAVSKGEVYKVICLGYGLTTDATLSNEQYATILKNAGYIDSIDTSGDILRWEFCEIINKITGRDQWELEDAQGNEITAETYGFTDLDAEDPYYKTMLIATSNFANGYVDVAGRGNRDELDKVKKEGE